jgi:hypothetical protein
MCGRADDAASVVTPSAIITTPVAIRSIAIPCFLHQKLATVDTCNKLCNLEY